MTHRLTVFEKFRQHVASLLHLPLSTLGLYAERDTPRDQYALTVYAPYEQFEAKLHHLGFVRNFVSSLKRREYEAPPEVSTASWVRYPDGILGSHQLHLALYVGADGETTDVYAHWEPSWIRHPIRHYRAQEVDEEAGVRRIRTLLSEENVEFSVKSAEDRYPLREEAKARADA